MKIRFKAKVRNHNYDYLGIEKGDWIHGYYYYSYEHSGGFIVTRVEVESSGVGSGLVEVHVPVDHETVEAVEIKDIKVNEIIV